MTVDCQSPIDITLIGALGSDLTVVNAARVSFDKESNWEDVKEIVRYDDNGTEILTWEHKLAEKDERLIRYLAREGHTTPFRHVQLQFRCRAPIFLARQLGKHQVGMSWNEVSRRYVDSEPEFYRPVCWRKRPEDGIKQGSSEECVMRLSVGDHVYGTPHDEYEQVIAKALEAYNRMIASGVAPEMARMVLPQSMITEWVWTGSLYGFFNVWRQRADNHAQKEAQLFAKRLEEQIPQSLHVSWNALKEFDHGG